MFPRRYRTNAKLKLPAENFFQGFVSSSGKLRFARTIQFRSSDYLFPTPDKQVGRCCRGIDQMILIVGCLTKFVCFHSMSEVFDRCAYCIGSVIFTCYHGGRGLAELSYSQVDAHVGPVSGTIIPKYVVLQNKGTTRIGNRPSMMQHTLRSNTRTMILSEAWSDCLLWFMLQCTEHQMQVFTAQLVLGRDRVLIVLLPGILSRTARVGRRRL